MKGPPPIKISLKSKTTGFHYKMCSNHVFQQLLSSQKKTNIGKTSTLPFVADAERAVTAPAVGNLLQSSNLQHIRSLPTVPVKHFCWLGHFEENFGRVSSRLFSLVLRISISKFLATK